MQLENKITREIKFVGDHYGGPSCGAISENERFCVSGGEGLVISDLAGELTYAFRPNPLTSSRDFEFHSQREELCMTGFEPTGVFFVHALRVENSNQIRVLLDPWSKYASIWLLSIKNRRLEKLQSGPDLRGHTWTEAVDF